ncbi:SWIM zinc finger family protein [Actinomadura terrae]|uniref:SWIM zinc finger family protein n=1 Tax=Actinomadura terrae TaxID=604353 RepID=UPI001FA7AF99|nr:hypothetical protein [Actinomadura terrae]
MDRQTVTERSIERRVGSEVFNRGRVYLGQGRVENLSVTATSATATVEGSEPYRVRLELTASRMAGECSCPQGGESAFCKHCVAVALAWVAEAGPLPLPDPDPTPEPEPAPGIDDARLRAFLATRDTDWLVEELMRAAAAAPLLRSRLEVAAGAEVHAVLDVERLRHRLTRAIATATEIEPEAGDFEGILEELDELVDAGFAPIALELIEHAFDLIPSLSEDAPAAEYLSSVFQRAHLRACAHCPPDPIALADLLVDRAFATSLLFVDALRDYAGLLGETGIARYRERVTAAWRAAESGDLDDEEADYGTVLELREQLAEIEGADALMAVLTESEPSNRNALRIARALVSEGRDAEAVEWVRRRLEQRHVDTDLCDLGADCLLRTGDRRGAVELLWPAFLTYPGLGRYKALAAAAGDHWPRWRERALTLLRESLARSGGGGVLVEILLWEDDVEGAWRESRGVTLHDGLRLKLARARGATHPADAVPVLLDRADREIASTGKHRYSRAANYLAEARLLAEQGGESDKFVRHMARLRAEHKAKSALRRYLDAARLP